jgi:cytochrome P450
MAGELPHASTIEGVRFTAQVLLPQLVQGLFRRRPRAVAIATKLDVDRHAVDLIGGLRRKHGPGPIWVRAGKDEALLVLSADDVRRVLEGAPEPFAADPEAKRQGMSHFQPDALTISRGEAWRNRRRFHEALLDTGKPLHRLEERVSAVASEETGGLLESAYPELRWDPFYRTLRRITRRVVLGDAARDDEAVTDLLAKLMDEANNRPKERSESFAPFAARIREYVSAAEEGSLLGLVREAPSDEQTRVEGQVPHWLFAMGETLAINAFRALALLASHPPQCARVEEELRTVDRVAELEYLEACLQEAMRLWPTTPLLSREAVEDVPWNGAVVPAGTQVLISNVFNHRDPETHDFADRFAPEAWIEGNAAQDWSFNHFSHGPQGCPGAGLALFVGKAALAVVLAQRRVTLVEPRLDPARPLPHMLDFFSLRFRLER